MVENLGQRNAKIMCFGIAGTQTYCSVCHVYTCRKTTLHINMSQVL